MTLAQIGGPECRSQNTRVLVNGIPKKVPPSLGNPPFQFFLVSPGREWFVASGVLALSLSPIFPLALGIQGLGFRVVGFRI